MTIAIHILPLYRLRTEYEAYIGENRDAGSFHFPHDYKPGRLYDVTLSSPPVLRDRYINGSSTMKRAKAVLPSWFWDACNRELDAVLLGGRRPDTIDETRKVAMVNVVKFYLKHRARYDDRPEAPYHKASINVAMLRVVLSRKPVAPPVAPPVGDERRAAKEESDEGHFEWDAAYLEKVFSKLCQIVEECGPGLKGWAGVRWLMYEEVSTPILHPRRAC